MLKTINSTATAGPTAFSVCNDKLYFSAQTVNEGRETWVTDGTEAGTYLLKDINPGSTSSFPTKFFYFNGKVLFRADDGTNGSELWITDGTDAGTSMLMDIASGSTASIPDYFCELDGKVYFAASDLNDGTNTDFRLWVTDGTVAGTTKMTDVDVNTSGNDYVTYITAYKGDLYFMANNTTVGQELFTYKMPTSSVKEDKNGTLVVGYDAKSAQVKLSQNVDSYKIYDISGKTISKGKVESNAVSVNLNNGIYIISTVKDGKEVNKKFVVRE